MYNSHDDFCTSFRTRRMYQMCLKRPTRGVKTNANKNLDYMD